MMRGCGSAQAFVIPRTPWAHGSPWGPMGEDKSAPRVACKQVLGIGGASECDNKDASELSSIFLLGTVGVEFSQLELSVLNDYVKDFW